MNDEMMKEECSLMLAFLYDKSNPEEKNIFLCFDFIIKKFNKIPISEIFLSLIQKFKNEDFKLLDDKLKANNRRLIPTIIKFLRFDITFSSVFDYIVNNVLEFVDVLKFDNGNILHYLLEFLDKDPKYYNTLIKKIINKYPQLKNQKSGYGNYSYIEYRNLLEGPKKYEWNGKDLPKIGVKIVAKNDDEIEFGIVTKVYEGSNIFYIQQVDFEEETLNPIWAFYGREHLQNFIAKKSENSEEWKFKLPWGRYQKFLIEPYDIDESQPIF
jgi:hypothetical protein